MKTILVPTDFSKASENAANCAIELASFYKDTKIILFHVYSIQKSFADSYIIPIHIEELETDSYNLLKVFSKKLVITNENIEIKLLANLGFVADEIFNIHEERNIDLTIMGIKTMDTEAISGGNIISVIEKSKKPVLVIPDTIKFKKPEKIAFACNYNKTLPDDTVSKLKDYINLFNAKILIFDVLKKDEVVTAEKIKAEMNMESSLADINHSISFPVGNDLTESINNFVRKNMADVLVMIPHQYSFIQNIFHHSHTKDMVLKTEVPLLSIHE